MDKGIGKKCSQYFIFMIVSDAASRCNFCVYQGLLPFDGYLLCIHSFGKEEQVRIKTCQENSPSWPPAKQSTDNQTPQGQVEKNHSSFQIEDEVEVLCGATIEDEVEVLCGATLCMFDFKMYKYTPL